MSSASERDIIVFNREIYNHLQLRLELEKSSSAPKWRGHSDTETLLAGFEAWGIEETIKRSTGVFAFAVWGRQYNTIILGRNKKPLYYGWQGDTFLFGSELKI